MKIIKFLLGWVILTTIFSCNFNDNSKKTESDILVFFDLSKSVDSVSFNKLLTKLSKLVAKVPENAKISIIPIGNKINFESIFSYKFPEVEGLQITEKERIFKLNQMALAEAMEILSITYQNGVASSSPKKGFEPSCFLESLNAANNHFVNLPQSTNKYLVYFSDMVEQCGCDKYKINMYDSAYWSIGIDKIKRDYKPEFKLEPLMGSNIYFIISSNETTLLNDSPFQQFWKEVFKKHGYSDDQYNRISKTYELPEVMFDGQPAWIDM